MGIFEYKQDNSIRFCSIQLDANPEWHSKLSLDQPKYRVRGFAFREMALRIGEINQQVGAEVFVPNPVENRPEVGATATRDFFR